jgi:hypothetical protein
MAMFFDTYVQMENGEECLMSAWSNSEINVALAVSTNMPRVIFMNDEGQVLPNFQIARGKNSVTQLVWHPNLHSLAIGWTDGCVTMWQEDER